MGMRFSFHTINLLIQNTKYGFKIPIPVKWAINRDPNTAMITRDNVMSTSPCSSDEKKYYVNNAYF